MTALERFLGEDCADLRAAPSTGVPEGSLVLGDPADVIVHGRGGRAGRGVRRAPGCGRARAGRGGAARHAARGPGVRRHELQGPRRLHPRVDVRSRVPGARRDRDERLSRLRQQEPRRLRRSQRRRALGQPRRPAPPPPTSRTPTVRCAWRSATVGSRPADKTSARCSATTMASSIHAASWFSEMRAKRARPAGPAQSSALHYFARSGPTKEAHRRALNDRADSYVA